MSANPIWIAGYFGPVAGAAPVWIAPGDGTVPSAVQSEIVSFFSPVAGATAVWIAGFFAPPPAAIGATPITIGGWGGSGGGVAPPVTSVWSASDAAANGMTLSNGGLTVTPASATAFQTVRGSIGKTSGLLYVEFAAGAAFTSGNVNLGFASSGFNIAGYLGQTNYSAGLYPYQGGADVSSGFTANYGTAANAIGATDVIAFAINFTTGAIWMAVNNVWQGVGNPNPATGTLPLVSFVQATVGALFPALCFYDATKGVWTLQPTAASQKYAPPSGFSAWDSAAPSHSAEALAYLARTVGGNEGGNGANIATLIDGLVSDGVWAKLDALYVLAHQKLTDALLNLVGTCYSLTTNGSFTSYQGFVGFTTGLNTGLVAPGSQYVLNSASYGGWVYAAVANPNAGLIGTDVNANNIFDNYGGTFAAYVNYSPADATATSPATKGLYATETNGTATVIYFNGTSLASLATVPAGFSNHPFVVGAAGSTLPTPEKISAAFIGASLGAAGQLALYNRLRTYMTAAVGSWFRLSEHWHCNPRHPPSSSSCLAASADLTSARAGNPAMAWAGTATAALA